MTRVLVATECSEEMQMQSSKLNSIVWNAVAGCADGFKPLTGSLVFCGVLAISCGWVSLEVDFAVLLKVLVDGETNVKAVPITYL